MGAAAAILSVSIDVAARRAAPVRCIDVAPSDHVLRVDIGDQVSFVANAPPALSAVQSRIVSIASRPGPVSPGPLRTRHVIVTATALAAGHVQLQYIDCSGTGC